MNIKSTIKTIALTILFTILFFLSYAQEPDTTLTLEEVEIRADIINKGGIVDFFSEIFDVQIIKKSFKTYTLRWNTDLKQAKNAFEDNSGIHVYIRPFINDQAFWPVLFKNIAERFYTDKIHPSIEYNITFTPVDTITYKGNTNPKSLGIGGTPEDFGIMDDPIELTAPYDTCRALITDTLITLLNNPDSLPPVQDSSAYQVDFYPAANQSFGFDQYLSEDKYAGLRSTYPLHDSRYLSYKSIKAGSTDYVYAFCRNDSLDITFKKDDGTTLSSEKIAGSDTLKINITGVSSEGEFDIVAYYTEGEGDNTQEIETGRIRIISYTAKPAYNLVLVPVNGHSHNDISSLANIQTQLNKIYAQAAVSWNVTTHANIAIDYGSDGVETFNCLAEDSRQYTMDMQHAIDMLNVSPAENTFYMFVLDQSDDPQIMGLMPYFQEYGFLFLDACQDEDEFTKTIGHELGHGAFGLEHEFFLYPSIQNTDPNLMTWHLKNTNLRKYQWDWIQNPFCMIDGNCGTGGEATMRNQNKYHFKITENEYSSEYDNNSTVTLLKANRTIKIECLKRDVVKKAKWYVKDNFQKDSICFNLIINPETEESLTIKADKYATINIELNKFNIENEILNALDYLKTNYSGKLDTLKMEFDTLITPLNTYITENNYDRFLIAGIGDVYSSEGMSSYFINIDKGNNYTGLDLIFFNMIQKDSDVLQYTELITKIENIITDKTSTKHLIWSQFVQIIDDNTKVPEDPFNFNFEDYQTILLILVQNKLVEFEITE